MIRFENIPDTEDGENFKSEVRLILQKVFPRNQKSSIIDANLERITDDIRAELGRAGYVYNRANLTFTPARAALQGNLVAAKTVERWAGAAMVAYFELGKPDNSVGIIEAFK